MMEGKRLDFNAPLLSVRRFASSPPPSSATSRAATTAVASSRAEDGGKKVAGEGWLTKCSLPFYKSDLKSGPVRNPGVVPFVWEQSPGRPKDGPSGTGGSPAKPVHQPPAMAVSKPPPGGHLPISPSTSYTAAIAETSTPCSAAASSSSNETTLSKCMERRREDWKAKAKTVLAVAEAPVLAEQPGSSDKEDGKEDAFSDAPDVLSHTESCFINCSTSGISGGMVAREPSGGFLTDPQVREFMMGRFLPAAQAMTAGSLRRAARKPPAPGCDPARRMLGDGGGRRPTAPVPPPYHYQHWPSSAVSNGSAGYHNVGFGGDNDDASRRPVKGSGWLPRLCLKGSLCLLNPIPVMKVRGGRMMNGSVRNCEFAVQSHRSGGGLLVKTSKDSPLQCEGPAVVDPDELCFVDRSDPVEQIDTIQEVSRQDHVVDGSQPLKVDVEQGKNSTDALEDLLPPALPKSPSESWLCQTLPSVISKNSTPQPFLGVQFHGKRQVTRASSADPAWETMAKTSAPPKRPMRFIDVLSKPANEE